MLSAWRTRAEAEAARNVELLSSMFGRMMPDALEKLKEEAPRPRAAAAALSVSFQAPYWEGTPVPEFFC